jgi:hypothetical protein
VCNACARDKLLSHSEKKHRIWQTMEKGGQALRKVPILLGESPQ